MVILLNGPFGIGKSTVAKLLRRSISRSAIYDPEILGFVFRRWPRWIPLAGNNTGDYQDIPAWRRLTTAGIRGAHAVRANVIVPMAFSNRAHWNEIRTGIRAFDSGVKAFCLIAPLEIVEDRLRQRGTDRTSVDGIWQFRRAAECCAAHVDAEFGEPVPAYDRSPEAIAADIVGRLTSGARDAIGVSVA